MNLDRKFIRRCIELANKAFDGRENPFGSLLVNNRRIVAEATSQTLKTGDITNHAEILVMKKAQESLGDNLSSCILYSNCEPCAMCSFVIRELKVARVVFSVYSPLMGGYSRWDILTDKGLQGLRHFYGKPPKVSGGVMEKEASKVFQKQAEALS